jgi:hypothetical protein
LALIAGALGMMRVCLAESIDWAQTEQTFGHTFEIEVLHDRNEDEVFFTHQIF